MTDGERRKTQPSKACISVYKITPQARYQSVLALDEGLVFADLIDVGLGWRLQAVRSGTASLLATEEDR